MVTIFSRMVTYFDGLLPIKSHNLLITVSFKITGQTKTIMYPYHDAYDHQNWQGYDLS